MSLGTLPPKSTVRVLHHELAVELADSQRAQSLSVQTIADNIIK